MSINSNSKRPQDAAIDFLIALAAQETSIPGNECSFTNLEIATYMDCNKPLDLDDEIALAQVNPTTQSFIPVSSHPSALDDADAPFLRNFLKALNRIQEYVQGNTSSHEIYDLLTKELRRLFPAEAVSLYLESFNDSDVWTLAAEAIDGSHRRVSDTFSLHSHPQDVLAVLATQPNAININESVPHLLKHLSRTGHLRNDNCFNFFGVPLLNRNGSPSGLLLIENRLQSDTYSPLELHVIHKLCAHVIPTWEAERKTTLLASFAEQIARAYRPNEILSTLFATCLKLLFANSVEFHSRKSPRPMVIKSRFHGGASSHAGTLEFSESLSDETGNLEAPCLTESQVVVPFHVNLHTPGVLVAKTDNPKLKYSDVDLQTLSHLALNASNALRGVPFRQPLRNTNNCIENPSEVATSELVPALLSQIDKLYGLNAGLVFLADAAKTQLKCVATYGCPNAPSNKNFPFGYAVDEPSLATLVFRNGRDVFVNDPHNDNRMNRLGVEAFGIDGPIVGVPIISNNEVIGVLVAWDRDKRPKSPRVGNLLNPFAYMLGIVLRLSQSKSMTAHQLDACKAILDTRTNIGLAVLQPHFLQFLVVAISGGLFERARVFRYGRAQGTLSCIAAFGDDKSDSLRGFSFFVNRSAYSKEVVNNSITNRGARLFDPSDWTGPGPDPFAHTFGKQDDLPWAVAPLYVSGRFYGQIAIDNALSKKPISHYALEYLSLLGALISQQLTVWESNQAKTTQLTPRNVLLTRDEYRKEKLEQLSMMAFQKSRDSKFTCVNKAFCDSLNRTSEEIIGKSDYDFYPEEVARKYISDDNYVMDNMKVLDTIEEHVVQGETIHVRTVKSPIVTDGKVTGLQAMFWELLPEQLEDWEKRRPQQQGDPADIEFEAELAARQMMAEAIHREFTNPM